MDSITLQCPITVKARVTEKFKTNMSNNLTHQIEKITAEIAHIDKDQKKALADQNGENAQQISMLLQSMEGEKQKRLAMLNDMQKRLSEIEEMSIGSEIVLDTLTRLFEVKVGDTMPEVMNTEMLIEDGKIIEIRE